ncbi:SGL-domain-containing protein [Amniculicola lignicola CBS 123094]|uniref:SGL-domain-containing protein n=1 Tax=Amniculicola lignicola CBS 123094 TaxID=1392246 RepID=A0A6A5WG86_9PLEO|nr:SGL-domain-containing protein [Amniculicola lignicola CBS 123094]
MGATLSKLWGAFKSAWTGGGAGKRNANGHRRDLENGHAALNKTASSASSMGIKKYEITEPWLKLNCSLGEGPFWDETNNTLRFIDIEKMRLHSVDLNIGASSHRVVKEMDISLGCTADIEGNDEEFIFGGKLGYGICNKQTGEYRWIKKVWDDAEQKDNKPHRMRGNDGAVDSHGRYWVGYMNDPLVAEVIDEGAVWRLDPDGSLHRPLSNIVIPNGTVWNKEDNTMYFADSPSRVISAFDYDPATGAVSNQRPFFRIPDAYGPDAVPDGHCLDEEGYMWTAVHGAGVVLRVSPQGELVAEVKVPTQNTTCPTFVGEDLVITSAGGTSGPDGKGIDEFAGSVFKIHVGVKGLKRYKFKPGPALEGGKADGKAGE